MDRLFPSQSAASTCENFGATLARGAAPGTGAAHMSEDVPTRHQPMIILVKLSKQPRGGTQQSAATGEGTALD